METPVVMFSLFGLPVTAYALCLVLSLCAALALLALQCRRMALKPGTASGLALLVLPLGLLGARAFYCLARLSFYAEIGLSHALMLWQGGYALWGAVAGAVLGALLTARRTAQSPARLLDALSAPGALAIALCRLAEPLSGEGIGMYVESESLCFFPLAVQNVWGEWYYSVFLPEALAALIIMAVLLRRMRPAGESAKLFFVLYCAGQVLLESLRRDNFLRWLFVRVSQLTCALVMAALMIAALVRLARAGRLHGRALRRMAACFAVYLVGVGCVVALEFAIDKSADLPVWAAYVLMAVCCAVMGVSCHRAVFRAGD